MIWRPIDYAPKERYINSQRLQILCAFKGQFGWVYFVCDANGVDTKRGGYANPTHWAFIEEIE